MTLMHGGVLPMDVKRFNRVQEEYHGRVAWKLTLLTEQVKAKREGQEAGKKVMSHDI
jgi:hypothetical protein